MEIFDSSEGKSMAGVACRRAAVDGGSKRGGAGFGGGEPRKGYAGTPEEIRRTDDSFAGIVRGREKKKGGPENRSLIR
jgi:hypothetical protein